MLTKSIENAIRYGLKLVRQLEEKNLLHGVFRARQLNYLGGGELGVLESYGLIDCVARETEDFELPETKLEYFVIDEYGRETQDLTNLSRYRSYKLITKESKKIVKSPYKVYKLMMTYEDFLEKLKKDFAKEVDRTFKWMR